MRLLLDTHVAIWAVGRSDRIPAGIQTLLRDPRNQVWVSAVSVAEIAIKWSLARAGVGAMPYNASDALARFEQVGLQPLSLAPEHSIALEALPPLHRDPYDRLLVAQALSEPMRLVTSDSQVAAYSSTFIHF